MAAVLRPLPPRTGVFAGDSPCERSSRPASETSQSASPSTAEGQDVVRIHQGPPAGPSVRTTRDSHVDSCAMKSSGKPDAGNLPVRFDEGDGRVNHGHPYSPIKALRVGVHATSSHEQSRVRGIRRSARVGRRGVAEADAEAAQVDLSVRVSLSARAKPDPYHPRRAFHTSGSGR